MALNPNDPNVVLIDTVANRLGEELRGQLVFVGGAVAGLLITDPAMPAIRPTEDVDLVADVTVLSAYHAVERMLEARGFTHDTSPDAPICRWRIDSVSVDVVPTVDTVLGFSNRWYPLAVRRAQTLVLPGGVPIQLIQAPVFVATKLEAFAGRGNNDYLFSHDLGDLIAVVDGRASLLGECDAADPALKSYLGEAFTRLTRESRFMDALAGHLPGDAANQQRLPDLEAKLHALAQLR